MAGTLENLNQRRAANQNFKRVVDKRCVGFRRKTEMRLRNLSEARSGKPERQSPHYFVMGECAWFSELCPGPETVTLDWRSLPKEALSVTYPDSFVSMRFGPDFGVPADPLELYYERVFFMDELADMVAEHGLPDGNPDDAYKGYHTRRIDKYIEVQVWTDDSLARFLDDDLQAISALQGNPHNAEIAPLDQTPLMLRKPRAWGLAPPGLPPSRRQSAGGI